MSYEQIKTNNSLDHFIYLDNNIYRLLKREGVFWDKFFEFFDKKDPSLLNDARFIFSWAQILEDINLGNIIEKIKQTSDWRDKIYSKKFFKVNGIDAINSALEEYWINVYGIVESMPQLQKASLMMAINKSINFAHHRAGLLLEGTLLKARNFIENENYIKDLSFFIVWEILTSTIFIQSKDQWRKRKLYLDSLTALWHKLFLDKDELNFYRLVERKYLAYVQCSEEAQPDPFEYMWLKTERDLCDGELIHLASLGLEQIPVICITKDGREELEKRLALMKQSLFDHERCCVGWCVKPVPGKIISLNVDEKTNEINGACLIDFNTPFHRD